MPQLLPQLNSRTTFTAKVKDSYKCTKCRPPCWTAPPRSLFSPNASCALYLSGKLEDAGLGHTFMCFNRLVLLAIQFSLTINENYGTHNRGLRGVEKYFFGDALSAPNTLICHNISVVHAGLFTRASGGRF